MRISEIKLRRIAEDVLARHGIDEDEVDEIVEDLVQNVVDEEDE